MDSLRSGTASAVAADDADPLNEWDAFEDLDEWFNEHDRSLAAYMTRQWRFRHGLLVFALIYAVAPACLVAGLVTRIWPLFITGAVLIPVTPVLGSLIVKVRTASELRRLVRQRRERRNV